MAGRPPISEEDGLVGVAMGGRGRSTEQSYPSKISYLISLLQTPLLLKVRPQTLFDHTVRDSLFEKLPERFFDREATSNSSPIPPMC